jgi:ubiquinone/menaquinone biosynthesis C-methylase UbiE
LVEFFKSLSKEYKTADFFAEGYLYNNTEYKLDISSMKEIPNESFDCVIACDVLEHVKDDFSGIQETYRVLNKNGIAIFTVPQKDHLKKTFEDNNLVTPEEREKHYGQSDHLRIYGEDFIQLMQEAGFEVKTIDENSFNYKYSKKHIIFPIITSQNPLATNFRKVFIGKKH